MTLYVSHDDLQGPESPAAPMQGWLVLVRGGARFLTMATLSFEVLWGVYIVCMHQWWVRGLGIKYVRKWGRISSVNTTWSYNFVFTLTRTPTFQNSSSGKCDPLARLHLQCTNTDLGRVRYQSTKIVSHKRSSQLCNHHKVSAGFTTLSKFPHPAVSKISRAQARFSENNELPVSTFQVQALDDQPSWKHAESLATFLHSFNLTPTNIQSWKIHWPFMSLTIK